MLNYDICHVTHEIQLQYLLGFLFDTRQGFKKRRFSGPKTTRLSFAVKQRFTFEEVADIMLFLERAKNATKALWSVKRGGFLGFK